MKLLNTKPKVALLSVKAIKVEAAYKIIIIALLAGILAVQIAILKRLSKPLGVNVQNSIEIQKKPFSF
jgi:hypothetical protein